MPTLTSDNAAMPCPGDLVVQLRDENLHDAASKVNNPYDFQAKLLLLITLSFLINSSCYSTSVTTSSAGTSVIQPTQVKITFSSIHCFL